MTSAAWVIVSVVILTAQLAEGAAGEVNVLTDGNFEHETQASTGSTTGPWFVKFYAPWCGHCKNLAPGWEELARELDGEVNVAKVDCTTNTRIASRFNVRGYPTLLFFKDGKMWEYRGARGVEDLKAFAQSGHKSAESKTTPHEPSFTDKVRLAASTYAMELIKVLQTYPVPATVLFGSGTGIGLALGFVICWMSIGGSSPPSKAPKRKRAVVSKAD